MGVTPKQVLDELFPDAAKYLIRVKLSPPWFHLCLIFYGEQVAERSMSELRKRKKIQRYDKFLVCSET